MKIKPLFNQVYLSISEPQAGVLDTSSKPSAIEYAEVLAVPEHDCDLLKPSTNKPTCDFELHPGDKIFVKAWAIDTIVYKDKKYHFINFESEGILAKVE